MKMASFFIWNAILKRYTSNKRLLLKFTDSPSQIYPKVKKIIFKHLSFKSLPFLTP